jgi:RNA polymerase sigma-70 factor (ECF subfamily)
MEMEIRPQPQETPPPELPPIETPAAASEGKFATAPVSEEEWAAFLPWLQGAARNVCRNILGENSKLEESTEEIASHVIVNVLEGKYEPQHGTKFSTWVSRLVNNKAIDIFRRTRRRGQEISVEVGSEDAEGHSPSSIVDFETARNGKITEAREAQVERIHTDRQREAVERALRTIPERYRIPVVLRDVEEQEYDEIAKTLGVPINTVKVRIHRGRQMLRERLAHLR